MPGRRAIVIFGCDHEDWPMGQGIEAFETLASKNVTLGDLHDASYVQLVHPVHQNGRIFACDHLETASDHLLSNAMAMRQQ